MSKFKVGDTVRGNLTGAVYSVVSETSPSGDGYIAVLREHDGSAANIQESNLTLIEPAPVPPRIPHALRVGDTFSYTDSAGNTLSFTAMQINARLENGRVTLTLDSKPR